MNQLSTANVIRATETDTGKAPVLRTGSSAVIRMRASSTAILPYISFGAQRLGGVGIVGLSLGIFSLMFFLSSNLSMRQEVSDQAAELATARESASRNRSDGPSRSPQRQAGRFVDELPGRTDVPGIMGSIVSIAAATGIELERGNYEYVAAADDSIARYRMALPVTGTYPQVRQFIEKLLESVPAIALDNMRIERSSVSDDIISADLRFSVLMDGQS